jgi:SAM-dependent methyltransferase
VQTGCVDDADVWASFIEFIGRAPAAQHPGVLFDGFGHELIEHGASVDDAERQVGVVMAQVRHRDDWAAPMFDRIYTSDAPLFSPRPNSFLDRIAQTRPPGRALDVAMGQGRNAVHLASLGWDVTGFDVSAAGLRTAQEKATSAGVRIHTVLSSSDDFEYGDQAWDLISICYALVPVTTVDYAATIAGALAPGGCVAIESFATIGGRPSRPVDLEPDELRAAYSALDERAFEVEDTTADWTLERALIVRLAAERRSS